MSVSVRELYAEWEYRYRMDLLAGEKGLDSRVDFICLIEDLENAAFMREGEFVMTTGVLSGGSSEWLRKFVLDLLDRHAPALAVFTGRYFKESQIDRDIIALCDEAGMCLFSMPYEVYIADIFRDFWRTILSEGSRSEALIQSAKNLLRYEDPDPESTSALADNGFRENDFYRVSVTDFGIEKNFPAESRQRILDAASFRARAHSDDVLFFFFDRRLVSIWHQIGDEDVFLCSEQIAESLGEMHPECSIHTGISENFLGLRDMYINYKQAVTALRIACYNDDLVLSWDQMDIERLFFAVRDRRVLEGYCRRFIGPVEDYDMTHNTEYLETLRCFLMCSGHTDSIAQKMMCHRNTVSYRMNKIREMLQGDLRDAEYRFRLMLAFYIRQYIEEDRL